MLRGSCLGPLSPVMDPTTPPSLAATVQLDSSMEDFTLLLGGQASNAVMEEPSNLASTQDMLGAQLTMETCLQDNKGWDLDDFLLPESSQDLDEILRTFSPYDFAAIDYNMEDIGDVVSIADRRKSNNIESVITPTVEDTTASPDSVLSVNNLQSVIFVDGDVAVTSPEEDTDHVPDDDVNISIRQDQVQPAHPEERDKNPLPDLKVSTVGSGLGTPLQLCAQAMDERAGILPLSIQLLDAVPESSLSFSLHSVNTINSCTANPANLINSNTVSLSDVDAVISSDSSHVSSSTVPTTYGLNNSTPLSVSLTSFSSNINTSSEVVVRCANADYDTTAPSRVASEPVQISIPENPSPEFEIKLPDNSLSTIDESSDFMTSSSIRPRRGRKRRPIEGEESLLMTPPKSRRGRKRKPLVDVEEVEEASTEEQVERIELVKEEGSSILVNVVMTDVKYKRMRERNNIASRRSRARRKVREADKDREIQRLEEENETLRVKVETLTKLVTQVKDLWAEKAKSIP